VSGYGAGGSDVSGYGEGSAGGTAPGGGGASWRPPAGGLTPDDVRSIQFGKAPFGRRGYDEEQVDAFLDQVEEDLRARYAAGGNLVPVLLTGADVQDVAFRRAPWGRRGYNEEEVDSFLDEVQRTVVALDRALAEHGITVSKR
jgi:DivIVA domain-containing protein